MMRAKNHAVVQPDANKQQTLNNLLGASFGAVGQRCMALRMGEAQSWLPELIEKTKTLKINASAEAGTDIGPVVSGTVLERISGLIARGSERLQDQ